MCVRAQSLVLIAPNIQQKGSGWGLGTEQQHRTSFGRENVNVFSTQNPHILLTFTECEFKQKVTEIRWERIRNVTLTHAKYEERSVTNGLPVDPGYQNWLNFSRYSGFNHQLKSSKTMNSCRPREIHFPPGKEEGPDPSLSFGKTEEELLAIFPTAKGGQRRKGKQGSQQRTAAFCSGFQQLLLSGTAGMCLLVGTEARTPEGR